MTQTPRFVQTNQQEVGQHSLRVETTWWGQWFFSPFQQLTCGVRDPHIPHLRLPDVTAPPTAFCPGTPCNCSCCTKGLHYHLGSLPRNHRRTFPFPPPSRSISKSFFIPKCFRICLLPSLASQSLQIVSALVS